MHAYLKLLAVTLIACSSANLCGAQSLGDVARQEQQKKGAGARPKSHHVLTDDDMEQTATSSKSPSSASSGQSKDKKSPREPGDSADAMKPSAAELEERIKEQKQLIQDIEASMKEIQDKLDAWKTSDCTHVVYAGTGKNTCDLPPRLTVEYERAKSQLKTEQADLEEMQEEARRMGYGNSVYDPK